MRYKYHRPQARATVLLGNVRIRAENREKQQRRVENVMLANKMRNAQIANQYRLELKRLEADLHRLPPGLQRAALLMNRDQLHNQYAQYQVT